MKKPAMALSLLALLVIAWAWVGAQGQPANTEDEQAAARKAVDGYAAAFEKGDLDGVMAQYTPDAELIDPAGKSTKGRAAIAALFKKGFERLKAGFKIKFQVTSVKVLKPELALEDGITERTALDGSARTSPYYAIWVKTNGKWQISLARDFPGRAAADKGEKKADTRVFEMKTYYAAPGKMEALHARFRNHTNKLFVKHGMTLIGFWSRPTRSRPSRSWCTSSPFPVGRQPPSRGRRSRTTPPGKRPRPRRKRTASWWTRSRASFSIPPITRP